jgi:rubredoxin-NAD+ reductase
MQTSDKEIYVLGDCAQIGEQCYAYIEPIHRQAQTIAAALTGDQQPFVQRQPLVRIKTPSLPLVVCPPPPRMHGHWQIAQADAKGCYMAYRVGNELLGFALSGNFTRRAAELYGALKTDETTAVPSTRISA